MIEKDANRIVPLGTVVKAGLSEAMVAGYYLSKEADDKPSVHYVIIPWPCGVMNEQSIKIVEVGEVQPLHLNSMTGHMEKILFYYQTIYELANQKGV